MKKILVFTTAYEPLVGGAEIALQQIAGHLHNDLEFSIITYRFHPSHPAFEEKEGVKIFRLGWGTLLDRFFLFPFLAWRKGRELHQTENFDVFWGMMVSYASIGGYFLKMNFPRVPLLLTLQEGDALYHLERGKFGLLGFWWKRLLSRADYVQAISNYLGDLARKKGTKAEIAVIPNGVDIDSFRRSYSVTELEEYRRKIGVPEGASIVTSVSRLVEKNGIDILIRAMPFLSEKCVLLLVGTGPQYDGLCGLVKELSLDGRVKFLGNVSHSELPKLLKISRVFTRPSRSEGLGNAFLESMGAGTPVVATPVGGIPDFLKDRQTGLFCKPEDPEDLAKKISEILENDDLVASLRANAEKLVAQSYSWESVAGKMKNIFYQLINRAE